MNPALIRRVADRLDERFNHRTATVFLHELDHIAAVAVEAVLAEQHPQPRRAPGTDNHTYGDGAPHGF